PINTNDDPPMNHESSIRRRIRQIKDLIGDGRLDLAFETLKAFMADLDGLQVSGPKEQDLQHQLIDIRNRFTEIDQNLAQSPDANVDQYNKALLLLLQLIDESLEVALNNPNFAQQGATAPLKDASPIYTASIPIEKITASADALEAGSTPAPKNGSENKGCLLSFANKSTNVNIEVKSFSFLRPLLGLASIVLVAVIAFYALEDRNWDPEPQTRLPNSKPSVKDVKPTPPPPDRLGKTGEEMGFSPGSLEAQMADYLSDHDAPKSKKFESNAFRFAKNKVQLNAEGKSQLDRIAEVLKAYPEAYLEILGGMLEEEEASYRGNKEITLDEVRARSARDYLVAQGIPADQLSFEADGMSDKKGLSFRLLQ
ncbi:MAG: OmpA family protein, partial [Bacteroidota bacterium]